MVNVHLNGQDDVLRWLLTRTGQFSTRSMYNALISLNIMPSIRFLCQIKIPLKVKIFLCFFITGVTLTKDKLVKRNWCSSENVVFVITMKL
jgi:hypothetical protein